MIKTETSAGVVTEYEYDYYGQQTSMEVTADNVTARTEYEYDQFGRQVLVRDALGRETSYDYDEYGRVIKTTFDDDSYITSTYDDFGRVLSETDALGNTKNYEYDEQGRLTAVILPEVEHPDTSVMVRPGYEYEYDEFGNRTVIRDNVAWIDDERTYNHDNVAGNDYRETLFTYDDFGNQLTRELPLGQTEYFEYDEETLRLIQHTDFEGNITESVYSDLGFLDELQYFAPGSDPEVDTPDETVEYTYNSLDQREQITDARGDTDYTYDEFDRLSQIDTPEGALNYEYDNYGRQVRKSIGNPADPTHDWTYSYDALGRLKTVSTVRRNGVDLTLAEVTTYGYDLVGNLARVDYANGMITKYEYDALNRLDVMTHYSPDETPQNLADNDKLAEYDYTVRADGRRTAVTEKYWESGTPYTTDIAWTYDNLGRLVEEDYDSHNNDLDYTTTFTYDLVGNRLSKVIDGIVDKTLTYEYDDNDRLLTSWKIIGDVDDGVNLETDDTTTTYGYTGTLQTSKTIEETYSTQTLSVVDYSYDLQGRMSEVVIDTYDSNSNIVKKETTTYVYDGRGIRVGSTYKVEEDTDQNPATALVVTKHEETSYLVDDMNPTGYAQVIEKIVREAGTATVTDAKVFTLGHDVIDQTTFIPGGTEAGSALTLLYDGHGSTRAVLDATAAFVQHYAYTAYGLAIGFDEAAALTTLLYSGEAFDSRVGLQYLRARWYDPNSGRFNRLDPFSGNLSDPQSLHKYLYTHGDPVNGIDPTGMVLGLVGSLVTMAMDFALNASEAVTKGGVAAEITVAAEILGLLAGFGVVATGYDFMEGEHVGKGGRFIQAVLLPLTFLPGGKEVRRHLPDELERAPLKVAGHVGDILAEYATSRIKPSNVVMADSLYFGKELTDNYVQGSMRAGASAPVMPNGKRADVFFETLLPGGPVQTVARDLKVVSSRNRRKIGDVISKGASQVADANHQSVIIELTDITTDAVPLHNIKYTGWRASQDLINNGGNPNLEVYILNSTGDLLWATGMPGTPTSPLP